MTTDRKLTWKNHIQQLKADYVRRLNLLKTLSNHEWGADKFVLLRLHKMLIRSKIDYGSIIYITAKNTTLKMLDVIHHSAIRIATGAFRLNPTTSLLNEAGEPILKELMEKLLLSYTISLLNKSDHPTHQYMLKTENGQSSPKNHTPVQLYVKTISQNLNLQLLKVQPRTFHNTPLWLFDELDIKLELTNYKKTETQTSVYTTKFRELQENLNGFVFHFTGASKTPDVCKIAIVEENETIVYQLPNTISVHQTEAEAVLKSIEKASTNTHEAIAICTDSQS